MVKMAALMTRQDWDDIVQQCGHSEPGPLVRRSDARLDLTNQAEVVCKRVCDPEGRALAQYATVIQASSRGCTLRTDREVPMGQMVTIELRHRGVDYLLKGIVAHSTGTVGGFKTGNKLRFPEPAKEGRRLSGAAYHRPAAT